MLFSEEESNIKIEVLNSFEISFPLFLLEAFPNINHLGEIPSIKDKLANFSFISYKFKKFKLEKV